MTTLKKHPIRFMALFYLACFAFRAVEYFFLRTDQSMIGEAFIHKVIGIVLLAIALRLCQYRWSDIGFGARQAGKKVGLGLLFGLGVFAIAYGTEFLMQGLAGNGPALRFYAASYVVSGSPVVQEGALFVVICVAGNIINVVMEEGVFRGLFMKLMRIKHSFWKACLLSSLLFGLWHIMQPLRNVLDGEQSPMGALMMGLMLVVTSALGGIQYVLLYKMTDSLWFGMAAHFVNNAIVNLLHVVTAFGADEMQAVRITIAQALSFIAVLVAFWVKQRRLRLVR